MNNNNNQPSVTSSELHNTPHIFSIPEGDCLNNDAVNNTPARQSNDLAELSLDEILALVKINPADELLPPEVAWEQVVPCGNNISLGTLGNISTIMGKAKSRKSFFVNMVTATVLKGATLEGFKGCLPNDKRHVLYFDTEQSFYYVHLLTKRICKQIDDSNPSNLTVYALRRFNPAERLKIVEYAIEQTQNLGFVVIDGIRDLVTSINDEDQSTDITSRLMKWSEEKNIHIVNVLHQNKNDFNARGHLGTEMVNKSETVLSVNKDIANKDISIVEADFCRGIEPAPFAFHVVDNLPEIIDGYEVAEKSNKKTDILNLTDTQKAVILDSVFKSYSEIKYADLVEHIQFATENIYLVKPGVNKVKDFIKYCRDNKLVFQKKKGAPYTRNESNDLPF